MDNFNDPQSVVPRAVLDYLSTVRVPPRLQIPEYLRQKWTGYLKSRPEDFIVTEPVPLYPGMLQHLAQPGIHGRPEFLSIGAESDMPGLRTDEYLQVQFRGRSLPAVAFTVVKRGETSWRVVDLICQKLTKELGRYIPHDHILISGLKDRNAVTTQTAVAVGVSMSDMRRIDWPILQPGKDGYFIKDVRPTDRLIQQGDHLANGFQIRVVLPGKQRAEIEAYMNARARVLESLDYLVPNAFDLQRLGPTQDNQQWGRTLLTGDYPPPAGCFPFSTNVEAMLYHLLFAEPVAGGPHARELRRQTQPYWQWDFPRVERMLRPHHKRLKMTLEYEVAKRLGDERYGGLAEAVLYDLRDRLGLVFGAWQAVYWNWALGSLLESGEVDRKTVIPLAFSCERARQFYSRTDFGRQCLSELAQTEELAARAEPYLHAFLDEYWHGSNGNACVGSADKIGLSAQTVRQLFAGPSSVAGIPRPPRRELSAAFVKYLLLLPRDLRSGFPKEAAPVRRALVRINQFDYQVGDEHVTLQFSLRSGSYATMVVGLLFDLSAPQMRLLSGTGDDETEEPAQ